MIVEFRARGHFSAREQFRRAWSEVRKGQYDHGIGLHHPYVEAALLRIARDLLRGTFSEDPVKDAKIRWDIHTALSGVDNAEISAGITLSIRASKWRHREAMIK